MIGRHTTQVLRDLECCLGGLYLSLVIPKPSLSEVGCHYHCCLAAVFVLDNSMCCYLLLFFFNFVFDLLLIFAFRMFTTFHSAFLLSHLLDTMPHAPLASHVDRPELNNPHIAYHSSSSHPRDLRCSYAARNMLPTRGDFPQYVLLYQTPRCPYLSYKSNSA